MILLGTSGMTQAARLCYVSVEGGGNGGSWSNTLSLHEALGNARCDEIWVKNGTYYPSDKERNVSFLIDRTVQLFGGFKGDEVSREQRDPSYYPSILSGNIGKLDVETDNSYHVVYIDGTTVNGSILTDTEINGFTITAGYADGSPTSQTSLGGGMLCYGKYANNECSPTLENLYFNNNYANQNGGALFNDGSASGTSSPIILNSTFAYNKAVSGGGAIYNSAFSGNSHSIIINTTFHANSGGSGGAIYSKSFSGQSNLVIMYSTFTQNHTTFYGGAIYSFSNENNPMLTTVVNSIFWNNTQAGDTTVYMDNALATIDYSIMDNACPAEVVCGNIISDDPALLPLNNYGGDTPTRLPGISSSAIDNADPNLCIQIDQRGLSRNEGAGCDIGSVEVNLTDMDLIYKHGFQQ